MRRAEIRPDAASPSRPAAPSSISSTAGLGRALKIWRALRSVKQSYAAELLDVSQAMISRWESGAARPSAQEAVRLRRLLGATPSSAADAALLYLVRESAAPVHLVCDLTHRLLAASSSRSREWRPRAEELLGVSLWPFASDEIRDAEQRLEQAGWFEPAPAPIVIVTAANQSSDVPIRAGVVRWTRLGLSDGSFVRLVETVANSGSERRRGDIMPR